MAQPQIFDTPPPVKPLVPSGRPIHTGAAPKAGTHRTGGPAPAEPQSSPERDLFLAVIERTLNDALGHALTGTRPQDAPAVRAEAVQWFTEAGRDFQLVCEMAEVDPEALRKVALRRIAEQAAPPPSKRKAA